ncbi:MAG TPA: LysR family transcriptional regulator [Acidobacteriaceae bacterium]|nr:LysR family transcriptional regulator [Acidobacteriaceae bacterium]
MFDLKQLECFVAVGEELHFRRAANRLFMTQPPLSRQIKLLEFELQAQLFDRNSRSVKLTPAGRVFLEEARGLLRLARNAAQTTRRIANGEAGLLHLGFTAGSGYSFLPHMLNKTNALLRGVDIVLHEMVTKEQIQALNSHEIDVGLLRVTSELRNIEVAMVAREPLILAVPRGHRLATGRTPGIGDLSEEPFIAFNPVDGRYFYEMISDMFRSACVQTRYVQRISQIHSILALVSAKQGVAIVPQSARALNFDGIVLRKLKAKPVFADLFLAWRKDNPNPALPPFRSMALEHFAIHPVKPALVRRSSARLNR